MSEKKELNQEQLKKVNGGVRPEEIGEPIMLAQGIVSYRVCDKCGACMFPEHRRIIYVSGTNQRKSCPNYICSECGASTQVIPVM